MHRNSKNAFISSRGTGHAVSVSRYATLRNGVFSYPGINKFVVVLVLTSAPPMPVSVTNSSQFGTDVGLFMKGNTYFG